jgi:hypothetical protein
MENNMNATVTLGNAVDAIDASIANVSNGIELNDSTIEEITFAVNNHKWIRDYLIGLPVSHGLDKSINFVNYLSRLASAHESYAFDTVLAMFHYEKEELGLVSSYVESAEKQNPNYELLLLIKRVLGAGWPSNSFTEMRNELAPKVKVEISNHASDVIEGE